MKVPFGFHKESNLYLGIDQVKNGLACGCICPSCKMQLKARHGDTKEHHFAHHQSAQIECEYSYWVAVRSMAKQIIQEKGIIYNSKKLNTFALIPWTNKAPEIIRKITLNPHIKYHQFDATIDSTLGTYYIYLKTNTEEDIGRVRSHYTYQPQSNTFSPYLVLEVDLYEVKKHNNKASQYLETLLFKTYNNKEWFSSRSSYIDYLEQKKLKEEQKALSEKIKQEVKDKQKMSYVNVSKTKEISRRQTLPSDPTVILARRMVGFYKKMNNEYNHKDKLSANLSIVYKGRNLWYVSCCNEFFCISSQGEYIVYKVEEDSIVRLTSSISFDNLDYHIKKYVVERDEVL